MGRNLGYFDFDELDRPELNKCPDCECFFATDECPLCGKVCPEAFRAGNRAAVKKPKKQKNSSGRVQFVSWYHSWWFILIMMYFMPIVGIILFITSPHSKKSKIIAASVVVGVYVAGGLLVTFGSGLLYNLFSDSPVNDKLTRVEYVEKCDSMSVEDYHRDAYNKGNFVVLELTVKEHIVMNSGEAYYLCTDRLNDGAYVYVQDCSVEKLTNYLTGDMIRVYGECSGWADVAFSASNRVAPLLYMAYSELIG